MLLLRNHILFVTEAGTLGRVHAHVRAMKFDNHVTLELEWAKARETARYRPARVQ
jgi:hypothetical protein